MKQEDREKLEKEVADKIIDAFLAKGYKVSIVDSEACVLRRSDNAEELKKAIMGGDQVECLFAYEENGRNMGTVTLIYGNSGWDVIHDYSISLEKIIKPIMDYAIEQGEKSAG